MPLDPRDELWQVTFETYYDAFYLELLFETLSSRWQRIDAVNKVLVAITASGSAVSGWALWSQSCPRLVWSIIAGIAAVLAIVNVALDVPRRLEVYGDLQSQFAVIRFALETFRYKMRLDPNFSMDTFSSEFITHRQQFANVVQVRKPDILITHRLTRKTKERLNILLADEIEQG